MWWQEADHETLVSGGVERVVFQPLVENEGVDCDRFQAVQKQNPEFNVQPRHEPPISRYVGGYWDELANSRSPIHQEIEDKGRIEHVHDVSADSETIKDPNSLDDLSHIAIRCNGLLFNLAVQIKLFGKVVLDPEAGFSDKFLVEGTIEVIEGTS